MLCDHPSVSVHASHCVLLVSFISSVLIINFLFFRLTLPAAEYAIVSSSSSPREQNVALGIKLFNYSVSYRLANLTLSVIAPWTHQWYVCLHIRVRAACVVPGVYCCSRVCERSSWMAFSWTSSIYNQSSHQFWPVCMRLFVWVTSPAVSFSKAPWRYLEHQMSSFVFLSACNKQCTVASFAFVWQSNKEVFY